VTLCGITGLLYAQRPTTGASGLEPASLAPRAKLELLPARSELIAFEPLIVRVTLTNLGGEPLRLDVRESGAPYDLLTRISRDGTSCTEHNQWLRRTGPKGRPAILGPGESASGDLLVVFDKRVPGVVFPDPGTYQLKVCWSSGTDSEPLCSAAIALNVADDNGVNKALLRDLERVAIDYYGYDPQVVERLPADQRVAGVQLLARIIDQQRPLSRPSPGSAEAQNDAALVASLADLLRQHPDSSYSGYLARYLGLIYLQDFRNTTGLRGDYQSKLTAEPAYEESLRYLAVAEKADLWPRATATFHLAALHGLAQEWDEANARLDTLRSKYAGAGGTKLADDLAAELQEQKAQLEKRRQEGLPTDGSKPSGQ
jgi:hypothetical protein